MEVVGPLSIHKLGNEVDQTRFFHTDLLTLNLQSNLLPHVTRFAQLATMAAMLTCDENKSRNVLPHLLRNRCILI